MDFADVPKHANMKKQDSDGICVDSLRSKLKKVAITAHPSCDDGGEGVGYASAHCFSVPISNTTFS